VGVTVTAHALDLDLGLDRPPAELLTEVSDLADRITAGPEPDRAEADVPPGATRE
jgi:5-methylcytosine-specific restriction enzyme subunit McrC